MNQRSLILVNEGDLIEATVQDAQKLQYDMKRCFLAKIPGPHSTYTKNSNLALSEILKVIQHYFKFQNSYFEERRILYGGKDHDFSVQSSKIKIKN